MGHALFSDDSKLLLIQHAHRLRRDGARWLWDLHALERELRSPGLGW